MITCPICGKLFIELTPSHIKKCSGGLSVQEFRKIYGDSYTHVHRQAIPETVTERYLKERGRKA